MIPCANCRTPGEAGRPCPNPDCEPPKCPGCGRRPWHETAVCRDTKDRLGCGYGMTEEAADAMRKRRRRRARTS